MKQETVQKIAERIASDVTTLLYIRAYENPRADPTKVRNAYIEWVKAVVNSIVESDSEDNKSRQR